MYTKIVILAAFAVLAACLFIATGCDKLTTQVNNNTYYDSTLAEACLKCHSDDNNQIVQPKGQWVNSAHASSDLIEAAIVWDSTLYITSACGPQCHTSEGFIKYTTNKTISTQARPSAIDCFSCHEPHSGPYGSWSMTTLRGDSLRPLALNDGSDYDMGKSQQCAICHQVTSYAALNVSGGTAKLDSLGINAAHTGAAAQILSGVSGYLFGQAKDSATHRSTFANGGCLACHFGPNTDSAGQAYEFGEHTFRLQAGNGTQYTANCNGSVGNSACHSSNPPRVANFYADSMIDSINAIGPQLAGQLIAAGFLLPGGDSTGFYTDSLVPTDAARILYNYLLYKNDKSHGVHNPKYMLQLLRASSLRVDSVPHVSFTSSPDTGCGNVTVDFHSQTTGIVTTYDWDFGDGKHATIADPQHTYIASDTGKFTVKLTVAGSAGAAVVSKEDLIYVAADTLEAKFNPIQGLPGTADSLKVTLTNTSIGSINSYAWDFGDGIGTSSHKDTTYVYTLPGTYTISLIVTNPCKADTLSVALTFPKTVTP